MRLNLRSNHSPSLTLAIARAGEGGAANEFNPQSLFTGGAPGYLYDTNDLSTLFLDTAGVTAASVNGLVGLQWDKSRGLLLGAELTTNGSFSTDTDWTKSAGVTIAGGVCVFTAVTSGDSVLQPGKAVIGRWYRLEFTVVSCSAGGFRSSRATAAPTASTPGTYVAYFLAASTSDLDIRAIGVTTGSIDNVSFKELPGNHRHQATTASKPVLRGTPTGVDMLSGAGSFTSSAGWTVAGGWSIGSDVASNNGGGGVLTYAGAPAVIGRVYLVKYTVTAISVGSISAIMGGASAGARTAVGTYTQYVTATAVTPLQFSGGGGFVGSIDNVTVFDTTADAVTAPYALQFDGVDDFLQTASVDFTSTDAVNICHGVRKHSDTLTAIFLELSVQSNLNNGAFVMLAPNTVGAANFNFLSRGTASVLGASYTNASIAAGATFVATGLADISGDSDILRINGVAQATNAADQGTGNYGNYALYFGRRGGTSTAYNGLMFSGWCVGKTVNASELTSGEAWVTTRTGVLG